MLDPWILLVLNLNLFHGAFWGTSICWNQVLVKSVYRPNQVNWLCYLLWWTYVFLFAYINPDCNEHLFLSCMVVSLYICTKFQAMILDLFLCTDIDWYWQCDGGWPLKLWPLSDLDLEITLIFRWPWTRQPVFHQSIINQQ